MVKADGGEFWAKLQANLMQDEAGELQCRVVMSDISERKESEGVLRKTKFTVDKSPLSVFWTTPEGMFTYVNETAVEKLGYTHEELLSMHVWDVDPLYPQERRKEQWNLHQKERKRSVESEHRRRDGTTFPVRINIYHLVFEGQEMEVAVVEDITESKKADEEIRCQAQIIENSPIIAAYHDKDLNIVWVNRAYEKATGLSLEECKGRKCYQGWNLSKPCRGCPVITAIKTGENAASELTPDNQDHWPETQGYWLSETAPVRDEQGVVIGALEFAINITERKQAEAATQTLNAELEQRVTERTIELEAVNKELESFAYSISHDFRSPLRALNAFSASLTEKYGEQLDEQGLHYLNRISNAALYMSDLVDALLSLSRITRAELKKQGVDISHLSGEILKDLQDAEPERRVKVAVAPGLSAKGDLTLLKAALENLIGNAWKFSSKEAQAEIEVGQTAIDGEKIFFVRDNGVGFNMAYAKNLFGAFQRLHGVDEFPGTGIGLATVQRIINRHGGRIWATSEVGKGATFYFTLKS